MKKLQTKFNVFSFYSKWEKMQKIVFIVGSLILLLTIAFVISEMFHKVGEYYEKVINKPDVIKTLNDNDIYPSALAIIWRETLTFTVISNVILGVVFIIYPFYWKNRKMQAFVFSAIVWITITFTVFWILISWNTEKEWKSAQPAIRSVFLHAVHPISAYVLFGLIRKDFVITRKVLWLNNILIIGYFIFSLVAFFAAEPIVEIARVGGAAKPYKSVDGTIYSFLNFKQPFFYKGGNIGIVFILDIGIIALSVFLSPLYAFIIQKAYRVKVERIKKDTGLSLK